MRKKIIQQKVLMEKYKNLSGTSGIESYELGEDFICVKFLKDSKLFTYSTKKIEKSKINQMHELAIAGSGLHRYINLYVRHSFDKS